MVYNIEKFNFYLNEFIIDLDKKMFTDKDYKKFLNFYNFKYYTDNSFFINIFNEHINNNIVNLIKKNDYKVFQLNVTDNYLKNIFNKIYFSWDNFNENERKIVWKYLKILVYYSK